MSAVLDQAHDASVQTSGPDLFGDTPTTPAHSERATPARGATCAMQFTGRLKQRPYVAAKPIDALGRMVPVLVLELTDVGAGHHDVVAHVPYTEATRHEAEAEAKRLQRDQVVTVTTSLTDIRMLLVGAALSPD